MSKDEISVPRELLERIERMYMDGMSIYGECEEIRALLAQPNTCTKDGGQCGLGGYCEPCHSVGPTDLPEPVAWSLRKDFLVELDGRLTPEQKGSGRWTPLYFHPPTKLSAVFPARKKHFEAREIGRQPYQNGIVDGWNAYDDEVKRLNPTL